MAVHTCDLCDRISDGKFEIAARLVIKDKKTNHLRGMKICEDCWKPIQENRAKAKEHTHKMAPTDSYHGGKYLWRCEYCTHEEWRTAP